MRSLPPLPLMIGCLILLAGLPAASALPVVLHPLIPSPDTGPYQDEIFFEMANETIYSLSDQPIPNGTSLLSLMTTQIQLSRMRISPDRHPEARQITIFLFYTARAGKTYADAMSLASKPYSPVYEDPSVLNDAREYESAARSTWKKIAYLYPGYTPYRLTSAPQPSSANEAEDFRWRNNPFTGDENRIR